MFKSATISPGETVRSSEPSIAFNGLDTGTWRFQLIVVDDAKKASAPAELLVRVFNPDDPGDGTLRI